MIFKGAPIALYILAPLFFDKPLIIRLSCVTILSAIEFWFTKNVLGRVLVGLKWSQVIEENGNEYLKYETKRSEDASNKIDFNFFWGLLAIALIVWGVFLFMNIFTISNLMIILVPFFLIGTNIICFYKCSRKQ